MARVWVVPVPRDCIVVLLPALKQEHICSKSNVFLKKKLEKPFSNNDGWQQKSKYSVRKSIEHKLWLKCFLKRYWKGRWFCLTRSSYSDIEQVKNNIFGCWVLKGFWKSCFKWKTLVPIASFERYILIILVCFFIFLLQICIYIIWLL